MKRSTFRTLTLNAEDATYYLTTYQFPGQRPLSMVHVRYLADLMTAGAFREDTVLTFAYLRNNVDHLRCINGQHTLHAIVLSGCPQRVVLEYRSVPDETAMAELYASYDRGRMRSLMDTYASFPQTHTLERTHLGWLSGAIPLIASGFDGLENTRTFSHFMRNATLRYQWMQPWFSVMEAYLATRKGAPSAISNLVGKRAAVLAVALVTLRYQPTKATDFWHTLQQDDGLATGTPEKTLIRWLQQTPAVHLKPHIYARYVAAAWNGAYRQKGVSKLYARDLATPILIEGTPHNGTTTIKYYDPDSGKVILPPARHHPKGE